MGRRSKQEAYFGQEVKAGGLFWAGGQSRRLILGRRLKQEAYFGQEVKVIRQKLTHLSFLWWTIVSFTPLVQYSKCSQAMGEMLEDDASAI